ncbi:N-acetylglucosamine-6-phosphate deacetylase [Acidimangrovimonas sediminis]|uniref:N-acetylglucosamine-6-phosphate deacetylase n=1 Tax=Acidimangrovimonas sediminis TaxID=2056283 RepID=UPI000C80E979|nr:N-acetylglucosamine-6-phosphate deacetylase [Acidimangrovimonas sediminis]
MSRVVLTGARVFDGQDLLDGLAVVIEAGRVTGLVPEAEAPRDGREDLAGGILAPGLIDLQVNGGGGVMLGADPSVEEIATICAAHRPLGSLHLTPTLITDTAETTAQVLEAGIAAARAGVPGFAGLHIEGPHLDPRRKGAHDPALIRPMQAADLDRLCRAAAELPSLMVTLAPEAAQEAQIAALAAAGVIVSLGHTDCGLETARRGFAAGARCATHLFNAMSQLGNREPGMVGAVLDTEAAHAGIIADGIHVAPETLRIALAAKRGTDRLFLVTDAMAPAGTPLTEFTLGGRRILRREGRLTLEDGTLAGADVTLPGALSVAVGQLGLTPEAALRMATAVPAALIGASDRIGRIAPGRVADLVHLSDAMALTRVWAAGEALAVPA